MSDDRPWYREPETFVAVAALIVSVSAVAVGIYEAALQRAHDRAEVWPHVELSTYITPKGAALFVENTGDHQIGGRHGRWQGTTELE